MGYKFNIYTGTLDLVSDSAAVGMATDFSNATTSVSNINLGTNSLLGSGLIEAVDATGNSGVLDKGLIQVFSATSSPGFPNLKISVPDSTIETVSDLASIYIKGGNATGTSTVTTATSPIYIIGGDITDTAISPATGPVFLRSGRNNNAANNATTGPFTGQSGDNNGLGDSGSAQLKSGSADSGISGAVSVKSGGSTSGGSGEVTMESGNGGTGTSGDVIIAVGGGSFRGNILFLDGTEGNVGDVITSIGSNGEMSWDTPVLGDFWGDAVDANIVPDGNVTRHLGSGANNFNTVNANIFQSNTDLDITAGALSNITFGGGDTVDFTAISNVDFTGATVTGLPASGANTALSNLASVNIGGVTLGTCGNITTNAAGTYDLGSTTNAWRRLYLDSGIHDPDGHLAVRVTTTTRRLHDAAGTLVLDFSTKLDASACPGPFTAPNLAADPTVPVNGDMWYNTTSNQLKARVNGVTVVLA